jgi:DNA-binding response OmpR family regulator
MSATKTILIADDDTGIIDATSMMLYLAGYEVISTPFGDSVPQLAQVLPHLIILDVFIDGVDGREICKILKKDPVTKDIPVLMLSAKKDVEHSAMEAGADYFMEKPFDMDIFLKMIDELILSKHKIPGKASADWFGMLRASLMSL